MSELSSFTRLGLPNAAGLFRLKSVLILCRALSLRSATSLGTEISVLGSRLFGFTNCLWAETKIGALPPGGDGMLGMEMVASSCVLLGAEVRTRFGRLFLRLASLSSCFSLRRARKGLGLRKPRGLITTREASVVGATELEDPESLLATAEGAMDEDPEMLKAAELLNLL